MASRSNSCTLLAFRLEEALALYVFDYHLHVLTSFTSSYPESSHSTTHVLWLVKEVMVSHTD